MIKVIYFITDLGIGGAEKLLVLILNKLDKNKFDPMVCCLYGGELLDEISRQGIKVVDLKIKNKFDCSAIFRFYRLLKKEKPDILHTHLFHANIIGRIIGRQCGVSVIISTQHYSSAFHGKIGLFLDRVTAPLANIIIAVSDAAKRFCIDKEGISDKRIVTIYNGIEIAQLFKSTFELRKKLSLGNGPLIGCVGRFVEVKGYRYLILAANDILEACPDAKFMFLGYGPLKNELILLTKRLNISDKFVFLDSTIMVDEFLSTIDVYVLPSLTEGLSINLLEAMAISKPVVVTNVGGNPEVVIDNVSGVIVPPRDPAALSRAVITILKDSNFANKIAFNARKRVEDKFNFDDMLKSTESLYHSLLFSNIKPAKPRCGGSICPDLINPI